jgi:L-malate glycosyltransferase
MNIVGGQSVQADRLLRAFEGHPEVTVRLRAIDPRLPFGLRRIPYLRTIVSAAFYYASIVPRVLASDVVHAFTSSFWGYTLWVIPAVLLSRITGRKVIVNYRDGRAEHHLRDWRSAVATLKRADAIVVPSQYLVDVMERFGLSAQVIPNAIDISAFRRRERNTLRPILVTNRGLEPLYNVDCTLRAFRLVQDRYPDARLVVANDGPLRAELEALARDLTLTNITFTGAVSQKIMAELYDAADIYVMSPLIDNMPGTLLECFASGLPIVSTSSGGVPYIADHERNALLVPPGSAEDLANACFRLLEEPELALRLAAAGYRDCIERYSADSVRNQWAHFYRNLIGRTQNRLRKSS